MNKLYTPPISYVAREIGKIKIGHPEPDDTKVGVFRIEGGHDIQVGELVRIGGALLRSFFHFQSGGRDYALYSPCGSGTRILELPSCKDIGGEDPEYMPNQTWRGWRRPRAP